MNTRHYLTIALGISLVVAHAAWPGVSVAATGGSITGRVRLGIPPPGNPVIRMRVDPMCGKIHAGRRVADEIVAADRDGGLANVFVSLRGQFPVTPVPATPVIIDQRGCIYLPRVVGMRVGQTLEVRNSDEFMHNVHAMSAKGNGFNVSVPRAGMVQRFRVQNEEAMLRLRCDVHTWMVSFVGAMPHDYFTVSRSGGSFQIANVPAGTHTIQAWHERYGVLSQTVRVTAGRATTIDFTFAGTENPPKLLDLWRIAVGASFTR